ncbi:MAG: 3-dehydroquinate synthase [Oscillospiraceae bacterium]|nr:3-dehydroquinate synthase [Oscillospiraceae bacterium]
MVLPVRLGERSYDVTLRPGCLRQAGELLDLDRRVLVVTDEGVPPEYAAAVAAQCARPQVVTVPAGEGSKSLAVLENLLLAMLEQDFTRADAVCAVGGGVVGDLAGFAAACYMRGIDFYNLPTTVLAQVDSSVGGKTAVNLGGVKNIVGAFHQPRGVLIDTETLSTLPGRDVAAGLAEAVKMGLIADAALFALFEDGDPMSHLDDIIFASLREKARVVSADEREQGLRRCLNFGHTVGHGIEAAAEGALRHGECVALGMLPMCPPALRARLLAVLERLGLPTGCSLDPERVLAAALHDKKAAGGTVTAVLVDEPGSFRLERMTAEELRARIALVVPEKWCQREPSPLTHEKMSQGEPSPLTHSEGRV